MVDIETREIDDKLVVTLLEGRLDAVAAADVRTAISGWVDEGHNRIVLNMRRVGFIDSSGLGALVAVLKRVAVTGKLVVCELQDATTSMFRLTRMDKVFPIFSSEAEALAQL